MTVAALSSTITYIENGTTLAFPAPFRFLPGTLVAERSLGAGAPWIALPAGAFTVVGGAGDAGGALTLGVTVKGALLRIRRVTPRSQPMDYTTGDRFPAESHEAALDRLTLIAQEEADARLALTAVAIIAPPGETGFALPGLADRRNRLPTFDAAGAFGVLTPLLAEQGIVTVTPAGKPVALPIAAITGSTSADFDGGLDDVAGDGQDFDGGYDG